MSRYGITDGRIDLAIVLMLLWAFTIIAIGIWTEQRKQKR